MKLGRFQHFGTSQNSILTFFEKRINFLGFHTVASTREDLSIDVSITTQSIVL